MENNFSHWSHRAVREIVRALDRIAEAIYLLKPPTPVGSGDVSLSVTGAKGRTPMAIKSVPPLTLSDVERVQLSLAPQLPDGSVDPGPFTWTSDNPAIAQVVGVDAAGNPDAANTAPVGPVVWVLTPAGPGQATITVVSQSANVDGNSIALTLTEGRIGNVNLSAGAPVPDA